MRDRYTLQDRIDHRLLDNRTIFLWGQIDDTTAKNVTERLLYLELEAPGKEIKLLINSPGGYVTAGFSIYDTMMAISSPISTICTGIAASKAAIILSAGEKGRRFVQPNGRVMIHQPLGGAGGNYADIEIQAREIAKTKQLSAEILARNCNQPIEKILKDFDRDHFMNAEEAVQYGIVDAIADDMGNTNGTTGKPIGFNIR